MQLAASKKTVKITACSSLQVCAKMKLSVACQMFHKHNLKWDKLACFRNSPNQVVGTSLISLVACDASRCEPAKAQSGSQPVQQWQFGLDGLSWSVFRGFCVGCAARVKSGRLCVCVCTDITIRQRLNLCHSPPLGLNLLPHTDLCVCVCLCAH